ncbi:hypothetical protein GCM10018962_77600 [Dactylosporangium matsuzakiense]|uniref:hypothetical protein n=1 Tax=Dactylosporangium matsuzakiense TaxID=53360 RepID=UPI0031E60D26
MHRVTDRLWSPLAPEPHLRTQLARTPGRGCPAWCWATRCPVRRLPRGSELGEHRSRPETFEIDQVGRLVVTMVQRPGDAARLELRAQVWIDRPDVDGQQALARAVVGDLVDALRKRR